MSAAVPQTMKAYRYKAGEPKPVAETVDVPSPGPNEVLVKVLAGGVCHSDLSLLEPGNIINSIVPQDRPFTIGHEGAGIIAALGSSVSSTYPALTIGTYVAVHGIVSCEQPTCAACSQGFTHLCPAGKYGLELDGTWASYMKVAAFCVVPVPGTPESIPPGVVSAATDAILTPYHAMKAAPLVPEHTVLCLGVGGLGYNAISIAKRCFGVACVVACDVRASALEDARGAGADYAVEPADLAALVAEKGLLVDFAFDFVGNAKSFETCFSAIRIGGTIHIVGLGTTALSFNPIAGMFKECKLKMSFYGLRAELGEVLKAIAEGKLNPKVTTRPMSECAQVLEEMHEGKLKARTALIPDA